MKSSQKGFSILSLLIVLLVVGLVGSAGWYVSSKDRNSTTAKTTQNSQPLMTQNTYANEQTDGAGFLTLTNYNVKIPLDDKTSGLKLGTISPSSYNESDKLIAVIAPQLDVEWKCDSEPDSGFKGTIGTISVTTQAKRSGPYEPLVTKKIGNYTFGFEQGGSNCTNNPEYQQLVDDFKTQFEKIEAN